MKLIYICGATPEKINDRRGDSVAGNKFSLQLAKALDVQCGGALELISLVGISNEELGEDGDRVWDNKKGTFLKKGTLFWFSEILQGWRLFFHIARKRHESPILLLENAPCSAAVVCVWLKWIFGIHCYSVLIDTPFTRAFQPTSLAAKIQYYRFRMGHRLLGHFSGLITFTKDVLYALNINIPCHEFAIGCSQQQIDAAQTAIRHDDSLQMQEKSVVYAGTLIYYNGIKELIDAFRLLDSSFQLHVYGYGPMEDLVKDAAAECNNITFHGRFDPNQTSRILCNYEVLINPRRIDPSIENFTFPSKLIDYLLTKKSVLTTRFKTLPVAYQEFLYTIEELSAEGIAKAVQMVFNVPKNEREAAAQRGFDYVTENQNYTRIASDILEFVRE